MDERAGNRSLRGALIAIPTLAPVPSGFPPTCPSCGYLRQGHEPSARCPECGADGLDGALVITGVARTTKSALIPLLCFGLFAAMFIVAQLLLRPRGSSLNGSSALFVVLIAVVILVALVGATLAGWIRPSPRSDALGGTIVWTVHATGIEIRRGSGRTFVPRDEIARLACADSIIGSVSQLQLVRRRTSMGGLIGSTPVLYIRGTVDERRALWRAARTALGLDL